jgi:prepilin-type N-terminal cleavage/methylation domain-containing protein
MPRSSSGFTLLELVIVLVIIGLLLGGVLKGQELLTGARVRSMVQQQDGMRSAYFGFMDRFRSPPGDYANAASTIAGISTTCGSGGNGNGDSRIDAANGEAILAWEHLSKSGFLTGAYACSGNTVVEPASVPRNAYGQFMQLVYDGNYAGTARDQHNLKTGSSVPSDIIAEIDRKVDDGNALQGALRGSTYTTGVPTDATCWDASGFWNVTTAVRNCGAAVLF